MLFSLTLSLSLCLLSFNLFPLPVFLRHSSLPSSLQAAYRAALSRTVVVRSVLADFRRFSLSLRPPPKATNNNNCGSLDDSWDAAKVGDSAAGAGAAIVEAGGSGEAGTGAPAGGGGKAVGGGSCAGAGVDREEEEDEEDGRRFGVPVAPPASVTFSEV